MGLGKTLMMLSAVLATLSQSYISARLFVLMEIPISDLQVQRLLLRPQLVSIFPYSKVLRDSYEIYLHSLEKQAFVSCE